MQGAKEKAKDMVSTAKAKAKAYDAKVEEKMEKTGARSEVQKEIAHERAKAKMAEAKMEMHAEKAQHREESMMRQHHLPHGVAGIGVQPVYGDPGPTPDYLQHGVCTGVQPVRRDPGLTPAPGFQAYPVTGANPVTKK